MHRDDRFYRCQTCERTFHVNADDAPLDACLAEDCTGDLETLDADAFARLHPEYAFELEPEEIDDELDEETELDEDDPELA